MANIFGILTAIVLALTAFVAYKNKATYETRISDTATQKSNFARNQERLKAAQAGMTANKETQTEAEAEIAKLTEDSATQKKANEDLKLQIEAKTAKVSSNKEQLDDIRDRTAQVGDLKELAAKMRDANAGREALAQAITDAEAKLANLTAQKNQAESQANEARSRIEAASSGRSLPTLNTRIRSIYPSWGFVTLAAGNNGGVVANSTLNVVRGGETIAQLLVTAVERGSSSASIIPDSLAANVTLMIGDQVVAAPAADKPERK